MELLVHMIMSDPFADIRLTVYEKRSLVKEIFHEFQNVTVLSMEGIGVPRTSRPRPLDGTNNNPTPCDSRAC